MYIVLMLQMTLSQAQSWWPTLFPVRPEGEIGVGRGWSEQLSEMHRQIKITRGEDESIITIIRGTMRWLEVLVQVCSVVSFASTGQEACVGD